MKKAKSNHWTMIIAATLCVVGCDNALFDSNIREVVRKTLKDPDSAKFEGEVVVGNRACIFVNSKNSFGGYAGAKVTHLRRSESGEWKVDSDEGPCNKDGLDSRVKMDALYKDANSIAIDKLKSKGLIPVSVKNVLEIEDKECFYLASSLAVSIVESKTEVNMDMKGYYKERVDELMSKIASGSCK